MKKIFLDWISAIIEKKSGAPYYINFDEASYHIHVDEIKSFRFVRLHRIDRIIYYTDEVYLGEFNINQSLIIDICKFFIEGRKYIINNSQDKQHYYCMFRLPLFCSYELKTWDNKFWNCVGRNSEPPAFYIIDSIIEKSLNSNSSGATFYKKYMKLPNFINIPEIVCCYQSDESFNNGEFNASITIMHRDDLKYF